MRGSQSQGTPLSCCFQGAGTSSSSHSHTLQSRSMHMPSSGQKGQSQYSATWAQQH